MVTQHLEETAAPTNDRLTPITRRLWPLFDQAGEAQRLAAKRLVLLVLLLALPALASLAWLVTATDVGLFASSGWLLLLLLALGALFASLNLANLFNGHQIMAGGAHGRFLTWSAVLVIGPTALWLDILAQLLAASRQRRRPNGRFPTRLRRWELASRLLVVLVRDTLPGLVAFRLYRFWGGELPLSLDNSAVGLPALYALVVHLGLTVLPVALIYLANGYGRSDSLLARGQRLVRFAAAVFLFYLAPEPLSLLAAGLFGQAGAWLFVAFWAAVYLLSLMAHQLNKKAVRAMQAAGALFQLERLGQAILRQPAEQTDLPPLLNRFVPKIFSDAWVEIRLLPDTVLFAQGDGWMPLAHEQWRSLLDEQEEAWVAPGLPAAAEAGFGAEALVVPVRTNQETAVGGIYLMRAGEEDVRAWEGVGLSLAAQIAAGLLRVEQFNAALAEQAEIYEKEIYEQAYQAEVYALALEYEKVSKELTSASQVQATFLPPEVPHIPGWQLAVTLEPAREMSGDFYDMIPLPNGRLGLVIADVADKGMGSALFMALSRTLIRTFATDYAADPARVLWAANQRVLADTSSDLFVTVFYAVLEPETGRLAYCNAGHNPPLLYPANGAEVKTLTRTAIPLGVLEGMPWEQAEIRLQPGDLLVMYTDGITEAENEEAEFFGEARLQAVAQANKGRSADIIESKVVTAVLDFVGNAPQFDDITLMILARDG